MSQLFAPLEIGNLILENRIIVAPMCQYSSTDGSANDWHIIHLGHLALSGAGLLMTEATAVSAEGRISPRDLGLYSDANERALGRTLEAVRANSTHAGRHSARSRRPQGIEPAAGGGRGPDSAECARWVEDRGCLGPAAHRRRRRPHRARRGRARTGAP
jgi:2,4-dienoyl-CoA reductase-like NADH-dependent reductase (Old Yellow Enzyme family)